MSMLAAPRRKQKVINLRAKNNAWSNDSNKFGQRMLEKMGWSSGKGLGAKENGMVDHVVARFKNDEKGLGYEDKNDQWTKHEDDFNALLANLSNGDAKEEKLHSGVSLEDKSKKSKARVHYHKFTRGKDLTKYSEKDLANIFGKKSLKNEEKVSDESTKEIETKEKIFTDKGSMEDYFKSKLAALKTKNKSSMLNIHSNESNDVDYAFRGFSGTVNDAENQEENENNFSFCGFQQPKLKDENEASAIDYTESDGNKKKKKKKKDKYHENEDANCVENENVNSLIVEKELLEEPKKKKKKNKLEDLSSLCENKKKRTQVETEKEENDSDKLPENVDQLGENYVPKKKKKKNKDNNK
ncbi:PIN2/TERF1-interacting telomerase inhibitor 1 [Manduca sexta]|uniref:PIN2/TERF1-interacting telomerase inhibitor 1 n=1 Tax=Manduca sexta TaxID=7130 RepID=UPI00189003A8|nr:PIN2/TERF1-interacting telomerase inhibitor 1 [Manduca sexta]